MYLCMHGRLWKDTQRLVRVAGGGEGLSGTRKLQDKIGREIYLYILYFYYTLLYLLSFISCEGVTYSKNK